MKARLLVLHRTESYSGQFGPEILGVCDEWTMDENPQWWTDEVTMHKSTIGDEASAWAEVVIDLPDGALMAALYPANAVPVTISSTKSLEV